MEENNQFIIQLTTKIIMDREPRRDMIKKDVMDLLVKQEEQLLNKIATENDSHISFARKMIEKEFTHHQDESIGFCQKYPIKTFAELRPTFRQIGGLNIKRSDLPDFTEKNNLSSLKLARPNLFEIIRSRALNMNDQEIQKLIQTAFDMYGIVKTVRGMMDSYFNMMLLYQNPRHWTVFCEFAYIWIGTYHINPLTCQISEHALCTLVSPSQ